MADNTDISTASSTSGDTIATDDISGIKHQRVKVQYGADGSATDVSTASPLPITSTELTDLGGTVGGSELQVDIVGSLPAGTAAIGKLAANDGVDIGDVGVTNLSTDPFGSGSDAAITAGSSGSISGKLRQISSDIDSVKTAVETIDNAISGNEMQVDVVAALPAGTNAIGKLAANDGVDIGDVDVTSQPARAATTDTVTAKVATDAVMNDTSALTPKFAVIDEAASGDNTIVAAVGGSKIRVLSAFVVAAGDVNVRFESGAGGTALTGQMNLTSNSGFTLPFSPVGWFESTAGALLNLELSGATSVDGGLVYVEV